MLINESAEQRPKAQLVHLRSLVWSTRFHPKIIKCQHCKQHSAKEGPYQTAMGGNRIAITASKKSELVRDILDMINKRKA